MVANILRAIADIKADVARRGLTFCTGFQRLLECQFAFAAAGGTPDEMVQRAPSLTFTIGTRALPLGDLCGVFAREWRPSGQSHDN